MCRVTPCFRSCVTCSSVEIMFRQGLSYTKTFHWSDHSPTCPARVPVKGFATQPSRKGIPSTGEDGGIAFKVQEVGCLKGCVHQYWQRRSCLAPFAREPCCDNLRAVESPPETNRQVDTRRRLHLANVPALHRIFIREYIFAMPPWQRPRVAPWSSQHAMSLVV